MLKKQVIGERGGWGYGAVITQPFICIVCIREKLDDKIEQRSLSREQHGSNNWEKQRLNVAECHQRIRRKRHDFLHKLSNYYAIKYDLVAVEDLIVKSMLESAGNSQNTASAATRSPRCSNTSASERARTLLRSSQRVRPKSVRRVALNQTNRVSARTFMPCLRVRDG